VWDDNFLPVAHLVTNTMAREVQQVYEYTHDKKFQLTKEKTIIRCDDGAVYEFEQVGDRPFARFVRSFDPDGTMKNTGGRKMLAGSVEEMADTLFNGWKK
jgi:hypothetical protein